MYEDSRKGIKAVCGFQQISAHPRSIRVQGVKNEAILDDWQTSFLVSKHFSSLTPYLGAKFFRVDYIHREDGTRKRRMSDLTKCWSAVAGVDVPLWDCVYLNCEANFFNEKAASVSIVYPF